MKSFFIIAILFVIATIVVADLPIHCLPSQVAGTWEFEVSEASKSTPDLCGYRQPDKSRHHLDGSYSYDLEVDHVITVDMSLPDYKVVSKEGSGSWTMVYDEGFNVVMGDMDFFAFHAYKPKRGFTTLTNIKPENYVSFCHKTLIGWYKKGGKFGCWKGRQIKKAFPDLVLNRASKTKTEVDFAVVSPTSFKKNALDKLFDPNYSLIEMVNSNDDSLWTAKVHEPFLSKTVREMIALTGNQQFDKNMRAVAQPSTPQTAEQEDMFASFLSTEETITRSAVDADTEADSDDNVPTMKDKICEYGLPCNLDWRDRKGTNWLSGIRNQGSCGSCYAMAFTTVLDARMRITYNEPKRGRQSTQHVVSCSVYNQGCDGGFPFLVGKHVEHFGTVSEKCFPYKARDGTCSTKCPLDYPIENTHYVGGHFGACSEEHMMKELMSGPIVVAFESPHALFSYHGGIFTGPSPRTEAQGVPGVRDWAHTNHAVVAVGWGHTLVNGKREKYWVMRNSWGATWGEKGHFRIRRGTNECGIESMSTAFTVKPKGGVTSAAVTAAATDAPVAAAPIAAAPVAVAAPVESQ